MTLLWFRYTKAGCKAGALLIAYYVAKKEAKGYAPRVNEEIVLRVEFKENKTENG